MLNESKVAIGLSCLAVIISIGQFLEARRANSLNEEDLVVQIDYQNPAFVYCEDVLPNTDSIDSNIRLLLINNSAQPVSVRAFKFYTLMNNGTIADSTSSNHTISGTLQKEPIVIPAKSHAALKHSVILQLSPKMFEPNGGKCRIGPKPLIGCKVWTGKDGLLATNGKCDFQGGQPLQSALAGSVIGLRAEFLTSSGRQFSGTLQLSNVKSGPPGF